MEVIPQNIQPPSFVLAGLSKTALREKIALIKATLNLTISFDAPQK